MRSLLWLTMLCCAAVPLAEAQRCETDADLFNAVATEIGIRGQLAAKSVPPIAGDAALRPPEAARARNPPPAQAPHPQIVFNFNPPPPTYAPTYVSRLPLARSVSMDAPDSRSPSRSRSRSRERNQRFNGDRFPIHGPVRHERHRDLSPLGRRLERRPDHLPRNGPVRRQREDDAPWQSAVAVTSLLGVGEATRMDASRPPTIRAVVALGGFGAPAAVHVGTIRRDIRGGAAADVDANFFMDNRYIRDGQGRVIEVRSDVRLTVSGDPQAMAGHMCDVMWNPTAAVGQYSVHGGVGSRIGSVYQEGHILGSQMDGSDTDPINFFPHHYQSNAAGSRWWRIEMIAAALQGALNVIPAAVAANCVARVYPEFVYGAAQPPLPWPQPALGGAAIPIPIPPGVVPFSWQEHFVPRGGIYTLQVTNACFAFAQAARANQVLITGAASHPRNNAYLRAFLNKAQPVAGTHMEIVTPWRNGPDMALAAAPATGVAPEYAVAANLFE